MQVQIHFPDVQTSPAILEHVQSHIDKGLKAFGERVTRVEVHLHDANGPKSGVDKKCVIEVRLAGMQPFAVEDIAVDLYDAITAAAGKAERAVRHKIEREQAKRRSA
ncbi:MAG: HPF/RaiA family ribosome-associated protein [Phycisphaeraceae bacterium]|nr:HPF/RaiA family ribosome-associated protein [Phycisphaeraceae bacterium]